MAGLALAFVCLMPMALAQSDSAQTHSENATVADSAIEHDHEIDEAMEMVAAEEAKESSPNAPPGVGTFLFSGKYLAFLSLAGVGLTLLLGRWVNFWVRIAMMIVAFILFGTDLEITYPMHPSPMCATTKLFMFKFTHGQFFPAFIAMFLAIFVPSLIGRKLFCGWVCPLGAFQELINKIPHPFHYKQFNFTAFNALRMGLLAMFFLSFFAVRDQVLMLGDRLGADTSEGLWAAFSAYNIYEPINLFELLHWQVDTIFLVMMPILVIASLILYRPFCYSICPIGALSWLFEKIAPGRVRINHDLCTDCGTCEEESPCPTIKPMVEGKAKALPDCTSCGECVKSCPEGAITFGFVKK